MEGGGFGAVEVCVVVNVVALVLAMVNSAAYGGGAVTTGEFLIWLSSLLLSDSLSELSDRTSFGSSNGGKSSSTGDGSLASLRVSSRS